ncbi:hypothetical protein M9H77_21876 [Catharanthus roseus]|uniref:Uncharacterized protein n=1 Tax=Catharanthus roseus TaxID=4058 RepID=A0ACC0ARH7_CATRO|nr:hypothetical protein M9H77_21876 [Catharanthus roseus]
MVHIMDSKSSTGQDVLVIRANSEDPMKVATILTNYTAVPSRYFLADMWAYCQNDHHSFHEGLINFRKKMTTHSMKEKNNDDSFHERFAIRNNDDSFHERFATRDNDDSFHEGFATRNNDDLSHEGFATRNNDDSFHEKFSTNNGDSFHEGFVTRNNNDSFHEGFASRNNDDSFHEGFATRDNDDTFHEGFVNEHQLQKFVISESLDPPRLNSSCFELL